MFFIFTEVIFLTPHFPHMLITREQLKACMPHATNQNLDAFLDPINEACEIYSIKTPERITNFIPQIAHESGELKYTTEIASGKAYEGRKDLGNVQPGDGERFKGRGLFQITGRSNYAKVSEALKVNFLITPSFLCMPKWAALSAGWYWNDRKLSYYADKGDFKAVTKKINGGYNGYAQRLAYLVMARKAFGLPEIALQPLKDL